MRHLKKSMMAAMLLCMALVGILAVSGRASAAEEDFVIENGVLKSYKGTDSNVVIPDEVKKIGKNVFADNKTMKTIVIPKGVKEIGESAFAGAALKKAVIPEGVTKMGKYAFCASKLQSITLPSSLKKIPMQAFASASNLKKVVIKKGCTTIGDHAFWYCTKLKSLTIPNSVKKIESRAFLDTAIKKITIPKSVTKINNKDGIFGFCERPQKLREITILNPKLKLTNILGIAVPADSAMKYGIPLQKSITIKGYKNSTAEKFAKEINQNKKKYKKSAKFVALKKK